MFPPFLVVNFFVALIVAFICSKGKGPPTKEELQENPVTLMPNNFIPLYSKLKPTDKDPTPLEDRFRHIQALDKRFDSSRGTFAGITIEEFARRLTDLRAAIVKLANAKVEEYMVENTKREYPSLRINNREIESCSDICDIIRKGPWDKPIKALAYYAIVGLWGENNQFAINMEKEICDLLRIKFSGFLSNGEAPSKNHKGKCISANIVKVKGTKVQTIRNCCRNRWHEAPMHRNERKKLEDSSGSADGSGEGKSESKLIKMEEATVETHGFHGKMGIFIGHPSHAPSVVASTMTGSSVSPLTHESGPQKEKQVKKMPADLQKLLSKSSEKVELKSMEDVLGLWLCEKNLKTIDLVALQEAARKKIKENVPKKANDDFGKATEDTAKAEQAKKDFEVAKKTSEEAAAKAKKAAEDAAFWASCPYKEHDRVCIWFPKPGGYYTGTVSGTVENGCVFVEFDDGDVTYVDFAKVRHKPIGKASDDDLDHDENESASKASGEDDEEDQDENESAPKASDEDDDEDSGKDKAEQLMGKVEHVTQEEEDDASTLMEVDPTDIPQACIPCNHGDLSHLRLVIDSSYFKEKYLKANPTRPSKCAECGLKFTAKPAKQVNPKTEYKVCQKGPVHCCPNAEEGRHTCTYALCDPCFKPLLQEAMATTTATSTKRKIILKEVWSPMKDQTKRGKTK